MQTTFRIPKLTDRELVVGLGRVAKQFDESDGVYISFPIPHGPEIQLRGDQPEDAEGIKFIVSHGSQLAERLTLRLKSGPTVLAVARKPTEITDEVMFDQEWPNKKGNEAFPQLFAKVVASARRELKATDAEAALKGDGDTSWDRYRDAQTAVLNSLQHTTETLILKAAENNAAAEKERSERFLKAEQEQRDALSKERDKLLAEIDAKSSELDVREKSLAERVAAFNTKESRYVARKKQEEQIEQVKNWLDDWTLTKATTKKRLPILLIYISAIVGTGGLTWYSIHHNYELLKTAADISTLQWWQWLALTAKAFFPLAACMTLVVYFIRWASAWARQHAEEEFRNRALLIDIGRSGWLLEAVRDAQETNSPIPAELLKGLSRNLFAYSASPDSDIVPSTFSDIVLQGLSSLRIKSPDGTEVEASRTKAKD